MLMITNANCIYINRHWLRNKNGNIAIDYLEISNQSSRLTDSVEKEGTDVCVTPVAMHTSRVSQTLRASGKGNPRVASRLVAVDPIADVGPTFVGQPLNFIWRR